MDNDLEKLAQRIDEKQSAMVPPKPQVEEPVVMGSTKSEVDKVDFEAKIPSSKKEDSTLSLTEEVRKSSSEASEVVNGIFKQGVAHVVSKDKGVQEKILNTAKGVVNDKVEALKQRSNLEVQASTFEANQEACENYGVEKNVPIWKIKMMRVGSAFWFIIYFIFATFTIAPFMVFLKGLNGVIKKVWLAALIAIVFYLLAVVGIPLISTLIAKIH